MTIKPPILKIVIIGMLLVILPTMCSRYEYRKYDNGSSSAQFESSNPIVILGYLLKLYPIQTLIGLGMFIVPIVLFIAFRSKDSSCCSGVGTLLKIATLKSQDPFFDEKAFLKSVSKLYLTVRSSISNRDLSGVREYLTEDVYQKLSEEINKYHQDNIENITNNLEVFKTSIVDIQRKDVYETISVYLQIRGISFLAHEKDMALISGSQEIRAWDTIWTFTRTQKAQDANKTVEHFDKCPGCGSTLAFRASGKCDYCHSSITKSSFDWVLSEINQLN